MSSSDPEDFCPHSSPTRMKRISFEKIKMKNIAFGKEQVEIAKTSINTHEPWHTYDTPFGLFPDGNMTFPVQSFHIHMPRLHVIKYKPGANPGRLHSFNFHPFSADYPMVRF